MLPSIANLLITPSEANPFRLSSQVAEPPPTVNVRQFIWERAAAIPSTPLLALYNQPQATLTRV